MKKIIVLLSLSIFLFPVLDLIADDNADPKVSINKTNININFPSDITFNISGSSTEQIESINLLFKSGKGNASIIQPLEFTQNKNNNEFHANLKWRTNTSERYIPQGSLIEYHFNILTKSEYNLTTKPNTTIYLDPNHKWENIKSGSVTFYYSEVYGSVVKNRSEKLLQIISETVGIMSPLLGLESKSHPLSVMLFNDYDYMTKSLPPKSDTIMRNLVTEGQAFTSEGVVLVLDNRQTSATATHELTHILLDKAAKSKYIYIPSWLHEGLAEYASHLHYTVKDSIFEKALAEDKLLNITKYSSPPGKPEDVLLFYGQSEQFIKYIITDLGNDNFTKFIKDLKSGKSINNAILDTYELDKTELENKWRKHIGASLISTSIKKPKSPTSPIIKPYTLDEVITNSKKVIEDNENSSISTKEKETKSQNQITKETSIANNNSSCGLSQSNDVAILLSLLFIFIPFRLKKNNII
ncbi:MAG: hypothetical protein FI681_05170 [SAR202 cluster bacterium]|nr:hypothetical protein [SAR202 cluster bacterium]